jgi:acetyltransferase-like isoleucine patch superfamily enzyme
VNAVFGAGRVLLDRLRCRRDPVGFARSLGVQVGDGCKFYGVTRLTWGSEPYLVRLGNNVGVASESRFITHDGGVAAIRHLRPQADLVSPIRIGSRVFIGLGAIILRGTVIGDDTIVAAGAVVRGTFPSGVIIGGVPAKVIGTVAEWTQRHESEFLDTGKLPPDEKRRVLLERFPYGPS